MKLDLDTLTLAEGKHADPSKGHCLLEVVSMFAGESFGDHPQCVCPALASFGRAWNDRLDSTRRQSLKRYVPLLVGTNQGRELSVLRAYMAADWAARTCVPMMLDLRPQYAEHAAKLRALAPITDKASASEARSAPDSVRSELRRASAAAYAASAASAAAYAAAAASAASASAAAYAAAYAACAAAYAAAYAACAAAYAAAYAACAAADATATREAMHQSAHDLYARMIAASLPVKGGSMTRDLEVIDRGYSERLDRAADRAAMHAARASELNAAFCRAAYDNPAAMVPTPGSAVTQRPVSYLIADYIDDADIALLLRDAANGEDMRLRATLLLSAIAGKFASDQADYAMEVE